MTPITRTAHQLMWLMRRSRYWRYSRLFLLLFPTLTLPNCAYIVTPLSPPERRPVESMSLGRDFAVTEGVHFSVRAEFSNVFNRRPVNPPASTNAQQTQQFDRTGNTLAGFGYISPSLDQFTTPRTGMITARLRF